MNCLFSLNKDINIKDKNCCVSWREKNSSKICHSLRIVNAYFHTWTNHIQ